MHQLFGRDTPTTSRDRPAAAAIPDVDGHAVRLHGVLDLSHDGPPGSLDTQGVGHLHTTHIKG